MNDTLYVGGYGSMHKRCKFQAGNIVYLCRITAPKEVRNSTLAYQKQRAVVLGYNKWQLGHYTIMFADGYIAQVLGAMLKKIKDIPDENTFIGWEKYVKPHDYEFKTPKPDKDDEQRRLKQLNRYGFRTQNISKKEYNIDKFFHKVVSWEIIAQCPYYGALNKEKYPLDSSVATLGMNSNCISIVRVIHDVINNDQCIGRKLEYLTVVPGTVPSGSSMYPKSQQDRMCLKVYIASSMKALLNRFYTSKHVGELISVATIIADPDLGCVLDI